MKFNTESDYERYLSRMRGVAVQVEQGITLMREAIRLNRTNHAVSMVSTLKVTVSIETKMQNSCCQHLGNSPIVSFETTAVEQSSET